MDSIYDIQNVVIDNFKEEEKGYFLPFKKDTYLRIVNDPINDGEIYGAFIDNKRERRKIENILGFNY